MMKSENGLCQHVTGALSISVTWVSIKVALDAFMPVLISVVCLARYQLEFEGGTTQVAKGYYKQAICLEPSVGMTCFLLKVYDFT